MGQALYRTHRPLKLSEVVGQEHVTTALAHALKAGTISHAYLFTGPRGTGKTSIARILAHEINSLPYDDESIHLDIIEIDAASNRRIDEIRDLRDKVHIAPTSAKYKVYIIDEVHMLTREAFNALLKTLEEPPAHAVFILATTEAHKLPETIISRTQRYTFKPVPLEQVANYLQTIADKEKIDINDEALELIAAHGEGSFRDSISLLDQLRNIGKKVELADVEVVLGIAPESVITNLMQSLATHNPSTIVATFQATKEHGYEAARLAKQLAERIRLQLIDGNLSIPRDVALELLAKLINVPASPDPQTYLEIILLDAALADETVAVTLQKPSAQAMSVAPVATTQLVSHHAAKPKPEKTPVTAEKPEPPTKAKLESPKKTAVHEPEITEAPVEPTSNGAVVDQASWPQVLEQVRKNYSTLYSILKSAVVSFEPGVVRIGFDKDFYRKRANDAKNKQIIAETIKSVTGNSLQINCILTDKDHKLETPIPSERVRGSSPASSATKTPEPTQSSPAPAQIQNDSIDTISNIFGGAELLES